MKQHDVKCWPDMFEAIESGAKPFDIRLNDRGYQKGDTLVLHEYDPNALTLPVEGRYSGKTIHKRINYVLSGWGLQPNHVCLGLGETE